jgi:hypothetical protein
LTINIISLSFPGNDGKTLNICAKKHFHSNSKNPQKASSLLFTCAITLFYAQYFSAKKPQCIDNASQLYKLNFRVKDCKIIMGH